jgi:predicted RNase H-like HicB family nuclease
MATAHVRYHYDPEGWWADSPEFPEYSAFGATLDEVRLLARDGLRFLAEDDALNVVDEFSLLTPTPALTCGVEIEEALTTSLVGVISQRLFPVKADQNGVEAPLAGV